MLDQPAPKNTKSLRGFLDLTGYYHKFIKTYGLIVAPLTELLKKNSFAWSDKATQAFEALKKAVTSLPMLRLPDISQPFTVECDATGGGIGVILMQQGQPIAFLGRALSLSTYEKELLALVTVVHKWRPQLLGQAFKIKTNQQALKYLLEQKVGIVAQQKWLTKLLGYDFSIEYKQDKENKVVDALSRKFKAEQLLEGSLAIITFPTPIWIDELKSSYATSPELQELLGKFQSNQPVPKGYTLQNGLILKKGRFVVNVQSPFKSKVLKLIHEDPQAGHSGFLKTYHRGKRDFYWRSMKHDIKKIVRECHICQINKIEIVPYPGLLKPLPIPNQAWDAISLDFEEG